MYTKTNLILAMIAGFLLGGHAAWAVDRSASRWAALDDARVLDTRSGLEWTRKDNGHNIDWLSAGRFCGGLARKWRLPTVDELASIYEGAKAPEASCGRSRCRVSGLFELTGEWFWSADSVGNDGSDGIELAWGVLMVNGAHTKSVKAANEGSRALCVRRATSSDRLPPSEQSSTLALPIDPSHTAVIFSWTHRGLSHPIARLELLKGTVLWNRADLAGSSVQVDLPIAGLRTGDDALNRRLRGRDFFEAETYPNMTFKSTEIVPKPGTNELMVVGELTVHGITQGVTLLARINRTEEGPDAALSIGFDADGVLRRSDFGLGRYVPMVGDEISFHITLEAHAE